MKHKKINLNEKHKSFWKDSEVEELIKILAIIIDGQKAYGKQYSLKDVLAYYRYKLEQQHGFTVKQVLFAIEQYTDKIDDVPVPADIIKILNPQPPRISEAQYVQAQKWQERNGYPMVSDALIVIEKYQEQQKNDEIKYQNEIETIQKLGSMEELEDLR